ncbi:MAG: hypothetical protein IKT52_03775, partial [Oscillospiraceae bacterium]|nr:hypothetical protein [Oscillospiraceae bacterium]
MNYDETPWTSYHIIDCLCIKIRLYGLNNPIIFILSSPGGHGIQEVSGSIPLICRKSGLPYGKPPNMISISKSPPEVHSQYPQYYAF